MNGITAFEAMSNVGDVLILESAEKLGLIGCPTVAVHKKDKGMSAFSRFVNSGWGVAAVCILVAVGIMGGIIWAGNQGRQPGYLPPTETTEEAETATSQDTQDVTDETTPPVTEAPDPLADMVDTWFTGVLLNTPNEGMAEIEVCTPYVERLGKTISVTTSEWDAGDYYKGDEIRMQIRAVEYGEQTVLRVSGVRLLVPGKESPFYYRIPNLAQYDISGQMLTFAVPDSPYQPELKNANWSITHELRIIKIDKNADVMYLTNPKTYRATATHVMIGIPDGEFAEGDHISVATQTFYSFDGDYGFQYRVLYAGDMTSLRIMPENEYIKLYEYEFAAEKPVLYLYPQVPTEVSVRLVTNGKLTCTYPAYGRDGWQKVMAHPDGTLCVDGREYYCLYWEAAADMEPDLTRGACVKGEDSAAYLEYALAALGLNQREANEFIIYWLPRLEQNPYNLITFQTEAYTSVVGLEITPAPDSLLRVCMVAQPLETPVDVEPQAFEPFVRQGFTAVEWGGVMLPMS